MQKCFRAVDFPQLCCGRKNFVKRFILHVTTFYLQHVFNMLKHLQKCLVFYLVTTVLVSCPSSTKFWRRHWYPS